ncbi:MAG: XRE family transcriptional regulator [Gemmatimonadales bacterium]
MPNAKWSDLKQQMDSELRQEVEDGATRLETLIGLGDLLKARQLTQEQIATRLETAQGNVSRTLRRSDLHVSTLRAVVEAMGGELDLVARFPDASYAIKSGDGE